MQLWDYQGELRELTLRDCQISVQWLASAQQLLQSLTKIEISTCSLSDSQQDNILHPLQNLR